MIHKTPRDLNKARYTATPVACGWARAIVEVSGTFGQEQQGKTPINIKKVKCRRMDRLTDGPTDKAGCRVA